MPLFCNSYIIVVVCQLVIAQFQIRCLSQIAMGWLALLPGLTLSAPALTDLPR